MDDPELYEPQRMKRSGAGLWVGAAGALLVAAIGGAGYFYWSADEPAPRPAPPPAAEPTKAAAPVAPSVSPEVEAAVEQPPRENPAVLLRRAAARGSDSKRLAKWLEAPGIFRRLAAGVRLVAEGRSPRGVAGFVEVPGRFSVVESWDPKARSSGRLPPGVSADDMDRIFIARESYARYDEIAKVFASANAQAWGRGYRRLRPYFERVFSEVAKPGERFDDVLGRAIERVLTAEVPEQPELVENGAIFKFKDPELEALSDVEKHLIRMGPKNAAAIQASVRQFARSAGFASVSALQP